MRRIVTAESVSGTVMEASHLLDAATARLVTNIWGFDQIPELPQAPDSVDLAVVIKGQAHVAYPGEDGQVKEIGIREGDFIVQNGAFHDWRNRSDAPCVIFLVMLAAKRTKTDN